MSETPKGRRDAASIAETIFMGARDLVHPQERALFLNKACGTDQALRERVERLLSAERKADQFLDQNPLEVTEVLLASGDAGERVGSVIGRYKLLQIIGEGGCGVVYMAEQEEPIRRRVALKVIKLGMDTRQVIARFEAERQALAMMDHPNIARVLDAGATEAGRPYFVMELVRGIRITEYCDQNHLATHERLNLFIKVAQAIQHAHQKGIIHRDIKPSNVLVTLHDGLPVPKVIDFGISKALEQKLTDKTLFTHFEQFIGTPAYTSPEQAEMSGLDIDTRSDIYSLGVLLYELLIGRTPFDSKELLHSGLYEMRRIIRETEPNRPSTRLSTMLAAERTSTAQHRSASSPELVHLLKGDLDWIVMKCLEKDRTRRYETANGLAGDIQHFLSNEPVTARPPSSSYRFGKLVRRNKLAVASGTAVVVALLAGIIMSSWQATRARLAEKAAQSEKESAEAVLKFFEDHVLTAGRPEGQNGGLGVNASVRQAIDAAESRIARSFQDRPLVEASIRHTLGFTYLILGEQSLARPQFERALTLRRQHLGLKHSYTLYTMIELGKTSAGEEAVLLLEEALKHCQANFGPDHLQTLYCMGRLAQAYRSAGRIEKALSLSEETLRLDRIKRPPNDGLTLSSMNNLALLYRDVGKLGPAITLMEETIKQTRAHGNPVDMTIQLRNLGSLYLDAEKIDHALPPLEESFHLGKAKLGPDHSDTLQSMLELASGYLQAELPEKALPLLEEALPLHNAELGADHPATVAVNNELQKARQHLGKLNPVIRQRDK